MSQTVFNERRKAASIFIVLVALAVGGMADVAEAQEKPFSWKDGKIYHGGAPIACFDAEGGTFSDVILRPGGGVMINRWTVYWSRGDKWKTTEKDQFSVDEIAQNCLRMRLSAYSKGKRSLSKTEITLSYEKSLNSYVYDVKTEFCLNRYHGEEPRRPSRDFAKIEFRESRTRYEQYLYQARDGNWTKVPLNYLLTPDKFDICFKRGRAVSVLWRPTADKDIPVPVVELTGLTPQNDCSACVMTWPALRIHLQKSRNTLWPWAYKREPASYRIYCFNGTRLEKNFQAARERDYSPEEIKEYDRPRFEPKGVNDFEHGTGLKQPARSLFWTFVGQRGVSGWCRLVGYAGRSSLRCGDPKRSTDCCWEIAPPELGPKLPARKACLLSAYVKTENLEGEGACIVCIPGKGNNPISSKKLTGNGDWQKLSVMIPASERDRVARIRLHHKGKGLSYFDCVKLEPVSAGRAMEK